MVRLQTKPQDYNARGKKAYITKNPLMIIFNHKTFDENLRKDERKGSEKDVELLESSFKYISFKIETFEDYTYDQIMSTLNNGDFSQYDSIVVVVLTYGEAGFLYAKDRRYRDVELIDILKEIHIGKPKILILQASRCKVDNSRRVEINDLPEDTMVVFSTRFGEESYRSIYSGSFFVKALSKHILSLRTKENFEEIMKRVRNMVQETTSDNGYLQVPEIINIFSKIYYVEPRIVTFDQE